MIRRLAASALISAAMAAPALAGGGMESPARMEILDGGMTARGTYMAALHLTLSDGWKTYWRAPGDAGIPPRLDWRGSRNLGDVAITWPPVSQGLSDAAGLPRSGRFGQRHILAAYGRSRCGKFWREARPARP